MKKLQGLLFLVIGLSLAVLCFHFLRTENGIEVIAKDQISLRDTFVDARKWSPEDYLTHSPRVRSYLLYKREYLPLKRAVEEKTAEYSRKAKEAIGAMGKSLHEWLSEKPQ